ncbi:MAG: hypothetical protein WCP15_00945 [bacterium]
MKAKIGVVVEIKYGSVLASWLFKNTRTVGVTWDTSIPAVPSKGDPFVFDDSPVMVALRTLLLSDGEYSAEVVQIGWVDESFQSYPAMNGLRTFVQPNNTGSTVPLIKVSMKLDRRIAKDAIDEILDEIRRTKADLPNGCTVHIT